MSLDIDTFGEIMDRMIREEDVQILIEMPAGTTDAEISTNMPGGGTVELYLLLAAIPTAVKHLVKILGKLDPEPLADGICELVRQDLVDAIREAQDAEADV